MVLAVLCILLGASAVHAQSELESNRGRQLQQRTTQLDTTVIQPPTFKKIGLNYYTAFVGRGAKYYSDTWAPPAQRAPGSAKCTTFTQSNMPRVLCAGQTVDATETYVDCKKSNQCTTTNKPVKFTILLGSNIVTWPEQMDLSMQAACKALGFAYMGTTRGVSLGDKKASCWNGQKDEVSNFWTTLECCR